MQSFTGTFTQGTKGTKSVAGLGFKPSYLRFTISQMYSGPEDSIAHLSQGFTDGQRQSAHSIVAAGAGNHTRLSKQYCITHYVGSGSALSRNIAASFVSFDPDGFTLNFDNADSNYQIFVEALA